jgi:hypothetical protein
MVFISLRALVSKKKLSNLSRQPFCNNLNEQPSMQHCLALVATTIGKFFIFIQAQVIMDKKL